MSTDDRDLERLLRAALRDEAERHEPAGDGLSRIRARTSGRRHRYRWLTPTLALAAAAAVIAAAVAAPSYLTGRRDPRLAQPGAQPASAGTPTAQASGSPATPTPFGSTSTPYAGDRNLRDMTTVWPYPSRRVGYERADQAVQDGTQPNLRNAEQTAVDFVAAFVGGSERLAGRRLEPHPPGVRILVSRITVSGEVPVSTVYLVRVRFGADAPYVVVGASRVRIDPLDSLTISPLPKVVGTQPFTAQGIARPRDGGSQRVVIVQLREPGSSEVLAQQSAPVDLAGVDHQVWTAELTPLHVLPSTGVVAAWTLDDQGEVVEFVAAPTAP